MRGSLKVLSVLRDRVLAWRNCRHDRSNVTSLVSHNISYIVVGGGGAGGISILTVCASSLVTGAP